MWKKVELHDLNHTDTFAFLNTREDEYIIGRVTKGSDATLKILVLNEFGNVTSIIPMPDWVTDAQSEFIKAVQQSCGIVFGKGVDAADLVRTGKATPDQLAAMTARVTTLLSHEPGCYILKHVLDFTDVDFYSLLDEAQKK